jgi:hypothetical protein
MITRRIPFLVLAFGLVAPLTAADPKPKYPFAKPPLELLDTLAKADLGKIALPTDDERKLLAAVWEKRAKDPAVEPKLTDEQLVNLMLFASGVEDADARKKYRDKLAEVRAACGKKLEGVTVGVERGEVLFAVVHGGPLKNGYCAGNTTLSDVFELGKYNCVSSSTLMYLAGKPHGFDLRPMSIDGNPGHAYLDMVNGQERVVAECTNARGFDWAGKIARKEFVPKGTQYDRKKAKEIDAVGLAVLTYRNRQANLTRDEQGRPQTLARTEACLLALQPADPMAIKNLNVALTNWGADLCREKKFAEAVKYHTLALTLAPNCGDLKRNAVASVDGLAGAAMDARKWDDALRIYDAGLKLVPNDSHLKQNRKYCEQEKGRANGK